MEPYFYPCLCFCCPWPLCCLPACLLLPLSLLPALLAGGCLTCCLPVPLLCSVSCLLILLPSGALGLFWVGWPLPSSGFSLSAPLSCRSVLCLSVAPSGAVLSAFFCRLSCGLSVCQSLPLGLFCWRLSCGLSVTLLCPVVLS